ncbi:NADPH-dependent F420 reductase [Luteococcus peritonei]|uniref:NADPH-dependent F420 reductase n=1 Tax=Luteococcus peritonei TaxID=88874 RepID=A0ABW4RX12_9ACTN
MELGIIGAGSIGTAIAELATRAGIDVAIANSRGPHTLTDQVARLGSRARAVQLDEAAGVGDVTVLSVPLTAVPTIDATLLAGRTVLDTSNYYPYRDGRIERLDSGAETTGAHVQSFLPEAHVAKSFSNILAHHIVPLARPRGAADRSALPVAGDEQRAREQVAALVDALGFDPVDVGPMSEAWRFEPETVAYTPLYARPGWTDLLASEPHPVDADTLRQALAEAVRVDVAARAF